MPGAGRSYSGGASWHELGIDNPAAASWRTAAEAPRTSRSGTRRAAEVTAGSSRWPAGRPRPRSARAPGAAAAVDAEHSGHPGRSGRSGQSRRGSRWPRRSPAGSDPARYELALALADLGAHCASPGGADARDPLRCALDLAQPTGATPLASGPGGSCCGRGPARRTALQPGRAIWRQRRSPAWRRTCPAGRSPGTCSSALPTVRTLALRHAFQKLGITSRAAGAGRAG
jgi:hypothetical protein